MQFILFTLVAVALYFFTDWLINRIEVSLGRRLKYRSVLFFVIILVLALVAFEIIDIYL